jgi:hypothetical protein
MNRILTAAAVLVTAMVFCVMRGDGHLALAQAPASAELWEVGRCYRVFPHDRDQFYRFRVLEPQRGQWVRVEPDPPPIKTPAMRQQAPLWLNVNSQFAVQEWTCAD